MSIFFVGTAGKQIAKKYIQRQGKVKVRSLKVFLIGPSRVGKTTTRRRLTHEIVRGAPNEPSTGIDSPVTVPLYCDIDQSSVNISKKRWRRQGIGEQFRDLCSFLNNLLSSSSSNNSSSRSTTSRSQPTTTDSLVPGPQQDEENPTHHILDEVIEKLADRVDDKDWKTIGEYLENADLLDLLHIVDIGGQPEFHEILPLLLHGPVLNLIFFNVTHNLDSPYTVVYSDEDGPTPIQYVSEFTIRQIIHRALCSISSLKTSVALLIGTHLDQSNEAALRNHDRSIQQFLKDSDFMTKDVLWQVSKVGEEEQYIHPLNNVGGDSSDINGLRKLITAIVNDRFQQESIPTTYLLLHLFLRVKFEEFPGWCSYEQCKEIAENCGISKDDLPDVLEYLHNKFGTVLYYRTLKKLSKRVIVNVNLIMKPPAELIGSVFGALKGKPNTAKRIRQTGEVSEDVMNKVCSSSNSESEIPTDEIVELMESRYILYKIAQASRREDVYFLPCLLYPDHDVKEESNNPKLLSALTYSPLLLIPSTGFIPLGLFQASIIKFSQDKNWNLDESDRFRNRIRFYFTDEYLHVEIRSLSSHLEIRILTEPHEIEQHLITKLRYELWNMLDKVTLDMAHTKDVHWDFGFYCPHSLQLGKCPHPAKCPLSEKLKKVELYEGTIKVVCSTSGCKKTSIPLKDKQNCWFKVSTLSM